MKYFLNKLYNLFLGSLRLSKCWGGTTVHRKGERLSEGLKMANLGIFFVALLLAGCKTTNTVDERTEIRYIDSTVIHNDTLYFEIPVEVYRDYSSILDTLFLETTVASAYAAVDTVGMILKGEIKNKPAILEKEYVWKERIIVKDSIEYRDKTVEVEKKVIPKWSWYSLVLNAIVISIVGFSIWSKVRK